MHSPTVHKENPFEESTKDFETKEAGLETLTVASQVETVEDFSCKLLETLLPKFSENQLKVSMHSQVGKVARLIYFRFIKREVEELELFAMG